MNVKANELVKLLVLGALVATTWSCTQQPATKTASTKTATTNTVQPPKMQSEHEQRLARAAKGDGYTIVELAGNFRKGTNGAPRDIAQAQYWIAKGVEKGIPGAFNQLALLHSEKEIPNADPETALSNFRTAHVLGNWSGTKNYANTLLWGPNATYNKETSQKSLPYYELCAERGDAVCAGDVALHYATFGRKEDFPVMLYFAEKGAAEGEGHAMRIASDVYYDGADGIPKNYPAALYWADKYLDDAVSETFNAKSVRAEGYTRNLNRLRARSAMLWSSGYEPKRPATSEYQPPKPKTDDKN